MTITIYNRYNAPVSAGYSCGDECLTSQEYANETNINAIIAKYAKTPELLKPQNAPIFGDVSAFADYQASLNQVIAAQELFEQLPSRTRERFDNDPARFVELMQDEHFVLTEAVDLGLASRVQTSAGRVSAASAAREENPRGTPQA